VGLTPETFRAKRLWLAQKSAQKQGLERQFGRDRPWLASF